MSYEVVEQHEYRDIYRLCHGVLVVVHKYEQVYHLLERFKPESFIKVKGIKNCYIIKNDHKDWSGKIHAKGSIVLDGFFINPINDPSNFRYELKTSSAYFGGNLDEFTKLLDATKDIIQSVYLDKGVKAN